MTTILINSTAKTKRKNMSEKELAKSLDRIYSKLFDKSQLHCIRGGKIVPIHSSSKKGGKS